MEEVFPNIKDIQQSYNLFTEEFNRLMKKKGLTEQLIDAELQLKNIRKEFKNLHMKYVVGIDVDMFHAQVRREQCYVEKIIALKAIMKNKKHKINIFEGYEVLNSASELKREINNAHKELCTLIKDDQLITKEIFDLQNKIKDLMANVGNYNPNCKKQKYDLAMKNMMCENIASTTQFTIYEIRNEYNKLEKYFPEEKVSLMLTNATKMARQYNINLYVIVNDIIKIITL